MDTGLYMAMNGALYNAQAQAVHANNLANASTAGFKADFLTTMSRELNTGNPLTDRSVPVALGVQTDFSRGSVQQTGDNFDIAIDGDGFIAILTELGEEGFTRSGRFMIDELGFLRNERGDQVLGTGGPIAIPEAETVQIGSDGTISIRALGQSPAALQDVERIRLVNPDIKTMKKGDDGLFYRNDNRVLDQDFSVLIRSGFVENSNVNAVHELTSITQLARQFEMNVKMMQKFAEMGQTTAELVRVQV